MRDPTAFLQPAGNRTAAERDKAMREIATRSYAIIDIDELAELGIDKRAASRRVQRGALYRLYRAVYSIVPPQFLRVEGRWLAGVKAARTSAGLSHKPAGALWDMCDVPRGPVHVSVPGDAGRSRRSGLVIHRAPKLTLAEITVERGIPVTTPARTLQDLQRAETPARFEEMLRRAAKRGLDLGPFAAEDPDRTVLERRFLALCRRHSLPQPQTQRIIGPYTVDFFWAEARLIVETDGFETHGKRASFESDRARDAWLMTQGYRVVRFTWRQLKDDPKTVVGVLRRLLS